MVARLLSSGWRKAAIIAAVVVVLGVIAVFAARALVGVPSVAAFIERHPGVPTMAADPPVGTPAWLGVQHFLNVLFMVLMIRTGLLVRLTQRPKAYWTRNNKLFPRTRKSPTKISFNLWIHLWLDALWLLNGIIFIIALLVSGHWKKVVPVSWDVLPNAVSVGLQYLSFNWPTENGWIHYNALQMLTYFVTIFIAAPLAAISGLRISPVGKARGGWIARLLPIEPVRAVHFGVMVYFVVFIVTHVFLVLATGARRNLNHMYAARDDDGWLGVLLAAGSLLVVAVGWVLARPLFLRSVAGLHGKVTAR